MTTMALFSSGGKREHQHTSGTDVRANLYSLAKLNCLWGRYAKAYIDAGCPHGETAEGLCKWIRQQSDVHPL